MNNRAKDRDARIVHQSSSYNIAGASGTRIGKHNYQIIAKAKIDKDNFALEPSISWHFRKRYTSFTSAIKLSIDF